MTPLYECHELTRRFGSMPAAVDKVSFEIPGRALIAITGPSGCGKTTLLRMVAGLEPPDAGDLRMNGRSLLRAAPHERGLSLVTQDAALYDHMSVRANLEFPLRTRGARRSERADRVAENARLLRIEHLLDRSPPTLSGGERRLVALGRALIVRPKLLLMDEPLVGVDPPARRAFRAEFRRLQSELGFSVLWVTHDHEEALALANHIIVMCAGRIHQLGSPDEVYRHPIDDFVAGFIGMPPMNILDVTPATSGADRLLHGTPPTAWSFPAPNKAPNTLIHRVGFRPAHIQRVEPEVSEGPDEIVVTGCVLAVESAGDASDLLITTPAGAVISVREFDRRQPSPGDVVTLRLRRSALHHFSPS